MSFMCSSSRQVEMALVIMRIGIGVLTLLHGVPKIMGGVPMWHELGNFIVPMGITFLLPMWGFLGACTEFFGGVMLIVGLWTRFASFCLTLMMIVATVWHVNKGDSFMLYSFPLTLIVIYVAFMISGSGAASIDQAVCKKK